jgi:hypothetical protein
VRQIGFFRQIAATSHFYLVLVLCTMLEMLSAIRCSTLSRNVMALPHARDMALLSSDVAVAIGEALLAAAQGPFAWLPFVGFGCALLDDEQLGARWNALPEWPEAEGGECGWTEGPLQPVFALIAALPLIGSFLVQMEPPQLPPHEPVQDGPLAAALKGHPVPAVAPALPLRSATARYESFPPPRHHAPASSLLQYNSAAAAAVSALADDDKAFSSRGSAAVVPVAAASSDHLCERLDAQQRVLEALQADRAEVRAQLHRLEELLLSHSSNTGMSNSSPSRRMVGAEADAMPVVPEATTNGEQDPLADLDALLRAGRSRGASKVQSLVSSHEHSIAQSAEAAAAAAAAHANSVQLRAQNEQLRRTNVQRQEQMRELTEQLAQAQRETRLLRERLTAVEEEPAVAKAAAATAAAAAEALAIDAKADDATESHPASHAVDELDEKQRKHAHRKSNGQRQHV